LRSTHICLYPYRRIYRSAQTSQKLATYILQVGTIQEKFLNTRSTDLLAAHEGIRKDLKVAIFRPSVLVSGSDLSESVQKISPLEESSAAIFASMAQNLSQMYSRREEIRSKIDEMRNSCVKYLKVSMTRMSPMMQGSSVDANKISLGNELKEYLSKWDEDLLTFRIYSFSLRRKATRRAHRKIGGELDQKGKKLRYAAEVGSLCRVLKYMG